MNEAADHVSERSQPLPEIAAISLRLPLHSTDGDAEPFIDVASRLITTSAVRHDLPIVYAIHVDHWFGPRWLGFRGKLRGIAGVRNRTLKRSLSLPPFHPNRVLGGTEFHRDDDGLYNVVGNLDGLHRHQPSEHNLDVGIRRNTLHAWYAGDTVATNKGVLMVYFTTASTTTAWYAEFDEGRDWRASQHVAITRRELDELLDATVD